LLDPQAEEAARAKLVADARAAIEAQGEFLRHDDWGSRALTYPIDKKAVAEYHLLQFHAGTPQLLSALGRSLRIADGILRFRIVKLKPGVPDAPDMAAAAAVARRPEPGTQPEPAQPEPAESEPGIEPEAHAQQGSEAQPAPEAEAEAEHRAAPETQAEPATGAEPVTGAEPAASAPAAAGADAEAQPDGEPAVGGPA
jgi:small subunit ribosomal protein S6